MTCACFILECVPAGSDSCRLCHSLASALEDALKSKKLASFLESMDISTQEPAHLGQVVFEKRTVLRRKTFCIEVGMLV